MALPKIRARLSNISGSILFLGFAPLVYCGVALFALALPLQGALSLYWGIIGCLVISFLLVFKLQNQLVLPIAKTLVFWTVCAVPLVFMVTVFADPTPFLQSRENVKTIQKEINELYSPSNHDKSKAEEKKALLLKKIDNELIEGAHLLFTGFLWAFTFLALGYGIAVGAGTHLDLAGFRAEIATRRELFLALLVFFLGFALVASKYLLSTAIEQYVPGSGSEEPPFFLRLALNPIFLGSKYFSLTGGVTDQLRQAVKPTLWDIILLARGAMYFVAEAFVPLSARPNLTRWESIKVRMVLGLRAALGKANLLLTVNETIMIATTWPGIRLY